MDDSIFFTFVFILGDSQNLSQMSLPRDPLRKFFKYISQINILALEVLCGKRTSPKAQWLQSNIKKCDFFKRLVTSVNLRATGKCVLFL